MGYRTDFQKVEAAFAALQNSGVMTRHNYWCCGSCASGCMDTEYLLLPEAERAGVRGAAFYTSQDADHMVSNGDLYVDFISYRNDVGIDEGYAAIAEEIVRALAGEGLRVEREDGDPNAFIVVKGLSVTPREVPSVTGEAGNAWSDDEDDDWG